TAGDRDHVLVLAAGAAGGGRSDARVRGLRHPGGEVEVVGGEVLDHADVRDAGGEPALAAGDDLVDLPQLPVGYAAAHLLQRRVVPLDVSHRADQAGLLEHGGDLLRLADVEGERLLDQRVDPGVGERERHIAVELGGHGHHRV